ncbi:hypothetical protein [Kitasatospora sp. NPDC001175]|uniref:hypothetical protein n=1 Tax=Kitasatospora sp. NPDC001175 TaxID=3157103 RepID=UPI003CFFBDCE
MKLKSVVAAVAGLVLGAGLLYVAAPGSAAPASAPLVHPGMGVGALHAPSVAPASNLDSGYSSNNPAPVVPANEPNQE